MRSLAKEGREEGEGIRKKPDIQKEAPDHEQARIQAVKLAKLQMSGIHPEADV